MEEVRKFVTFGLGQRKEKNLKVRQPLAGATLKRNEKFETELEKLVREELNIKKVLYDANLPADIVLDEKLTPELVTEGWIRELLRQIQDMRKEMGYRFDEKVLSQWHSEDKEVADAVNQWAEFIKKNSLLREFNLKHIEGDKSFDIQKEFELAPQKKIWIGVRK